MSKPRIAAVMLAVTMLCASFVRSYSQSEKPAPFQIVETSIDDIHAAMKAGKLNAHQLVQGYLDRINAYDKRGPNINSIITLNPQALAEADKLDAAYQASGFVGPLHGIPVLVKDEIDAAGMPTTLGTLVFKDYRPTRDAFVVEKLRKAGAIILGKTTLSEYAAGDTYGSMFGATRNPYDLERTAGGSSGDRRFAQPEGHHPRQVADLTVNGLTFYGSADRQLHWAATARVSGIRMPEARGRP